MKSSPFSKNNFWLLADDVKDALQISIDVSEPI